QTATLPISLSISNTEVVDVNAQAELVETERTSSTNTIQQQRIDNLPINGRNYINFTLTNSQATRDVAPSIGAAPTSGLNFGGQRARSNLVNVDGVDAVDNSVNGIRSTVSPVRCVASRSAPSQHSPAPRSFPIQPPTGSEAPPPVPLSGARAARPGG